MVYAPDTVTGTHVRFQSINFIVNAPSVRQILENIDKIFEIASSTII